MSTKLKSFGYAFLTLFCLFCLNARADQGPVVGYVKTSSGTVVLVNDGQPVSVTVGTPVRIGDHLRTAANSSVGLTLRDNTMLSLGPDSELSIDEYLFEPTREELRLAARLLHGTLQFISGVIAKLKPEAVSIETPSATIGVRGTRFVVKAGE
ncbi:MAG: FecR family protein [Azoarcus sp.]|nr:FecR domain-containing protein [Azoarcus sp.]MDD2872366.1 FecR family protein [Azoarcus sp.]MDX9837484.1 FecR family protein [Azoarcus sp.]